MTNTIDNVGIIAMEMYFPRTYVDQAELEQFDHVDTGKYTIGLGLKHMSFCTIIEDITSICLTVTAMLLEATKIDRSTIGFLAVGTETVIDKSKSVKTHLMTLFDDVNTDIEGVDENNACFGGTQVLFHAVDWIYSNWINGYNERYAIVVMGDIAVYDGSSAARCTGGAGAIAMLIGPNAALSIDRHLRAIHMINAYDFYKPHMNSEYATFDGPLSVHTYTSAVDRCYRLYKHKYKLMLAHDQDDHITVGSFRSILFHSPYARLVQKSFARLVFHDCVDDVANHNGICSQDIDQFRSQIDGSCREVDKTLEKKMTTATSRLFDQKCESNLLFGRRLGNIYTPSLYTQLFAHLLSSDLTDLFNSRLLLFSFGSGSAAAMFSITVTNTIEKLVGLRASADDAHRRLNNRVKQTPDEYAVAMSMRESLSNLVAHRLHFDQQKVTSMLDTTAQQQQQLYPGTFYLTSIDSKCRRYYQRTPK